MPDLEDIRYGGDEPDINWLSQRWEEATNDLGYFRDQTDENHKTRYAEWAGQTTDGKKHGLDPKPWEGASDLRLFLCDEIIDYQKSVLTTAASSANLVAIPTEGNDIARAKITQGFMKWLVQTQIPHRDREEELLADYMLEKGAAAIGVFWESKQCKYNQRASLDDLAQAQPQLAESILNPQNDEMTIEVFQQFYPDLKKKRLRAMLRELRDKGETMIPVAGQKINRPVIYAYALDEDLIIPAQATDIECCPYLFRRHYMTPEEMLIKVESEGWDEGWVKETIRTQKGDMDVSQVTTTSSSVNPVASSRQIPDEFRGLVLVVYAYERLVDDNLIPGIYETVFNPYVPPLSEKKGHKGYAKTGLMGYAHGDYPFVIFKREHLSRRLHDSRGVPELGKGHQIQIKVQQDSRVDNTSMGTLPPFEYPTGRKPSSLGPGSGVPTRRRGEVGYMERPPIPTASIEVERTLKEDFNRMFGRANNEQDASEARDKRQAMVRRWLTSWQKVYQQVWSLFQQYGDDEVYFRVIGSVKSEPQKFEKGNPQEKYDFYLSYDVLQSDPETMQAKLKAIGEFIQVADRNGQIDYSEFLQAGIEAIDPILGERIIQPKEAASEKEVKEEHDAIARMVAGVQENIPLGAANELRLQVLQQWMQSPGGQQWLQNETIAKAFQTRAQMYQHQLQQKQNAIVGRFGADAFQQNAG